jgi:hypothetical protein
MTVMFKIILLGAQSKKDLSISIIIVHARYILLYKFESFISKEGMIFCQ